MELNDADFKRLVHFVQSNYGIDLSRKRELIVGRMSTSLRKLGYNNFTAFVDHLLNVRDQSEISLLLEKLTTNYTFFMREASHLEFFRDVIIPDIVSRHARDKCLSIWSAGCSSGEEPYNISMYLKDYLGARAGEWDTRILATDISPKALAKAKLGVYELPDTLPADWRKKYFIEQQNGLYAVAPEIKDNVIFQTFNLMDPIRFRQKFDVIFCRNVMIYFNQDTKKKLIERFYHATATGGYFLISYSENLSQDNPYHRVAMATYQK